MNARPVPREWSKGQGERIAHAMNRSKETALSPPPVSTTARAVMWALVWLVILIVGLAVVAYIEASHG